MKRELLIVLALVACSAPPQTDPAAEEQKQAAAAARMAANREARRANVEAHREIRDWAVQHEADVGVAGVTKGALQAGHVATHVLVRCEGGQPVETLRCLQDEDPDPHQYKSSLAKAWLKAWFACDGAKIPNEAAYKCTAKRYREGGLGKGG